MRKIHVSFGGTHPAKVTEQLDLEWFEFVTRLLSPVRTMDKASAGWFCPARFDPSYRDGAHLTERHALTFDYDTVTREDMRVVQDAYFNWEYAIYTTWSHAPEKPRVRIVFPTTRPMTAEEFCAVSRKVASWAGIEYAARESHVPAQIAYNPTAKPDGEFRGGRHEGQWIDPDAVLDGWDWHDRTQWPARAAGDTTYNPKEMPIPPDEKPGLVGMFCRAYTCEEAIEEFKLPYDRVS